MKILKRLLIVLVTPFVLLFIAIVYIVSLVSWIFFGVHYLDEVSDFLDKLI
jgi:hypothetical protein